jgi:hypothetical protein
MLERARCRKVMELHRRGTFGVHALRRESEQLHQGDAFASRVMWV